MFRPKYVRHVNDIPLDPHFAVLEDESTLCDGDTVSYMNYLAFENIEQVTQWIHEKDAADTKYGGARRSFRVMEIRPCTVHRHVHITVSRDTQSV